MFCFTLYLTKYLLIQFVTRIKKCFNEFSHALFLCVMKEKE